MLQLQCCSGASVCIEMPFSFSVAVRNTDVNLALSSTFTRDLRNSNWTKIYTILQSGKEPFDNIGRLSMEYCLSKICFFLC